jgi:hypothetical protein
MLASQLPNSSAYQPRHLQGAGVLLRGRDLPGVGLPIAPRRGGQQDIASLPPGVDPRAEPPGRVAQRGVRGGEEQVPPAARRPARGRDRLPQPEPGRQMGPALRAGGIAFDVEVDDEEAGRAAGQADVRLRPARPPLLDGLWVGCGPVGPVLQQGAFVPRPHRVDGPAPAGVGQGRCRQRSSPRGRRLILFAHGSNPSGMALTSRTYVSFSPLLYAAPCAPSSRSEPAFRNSYSPKGVGPRYYVPSRKLKKLPGR